jgi:NAD+ diphosphatase
MNENVYADAGLDRASYLRRDATWIAARLADPATRFVTVWRGRNLVVTGGEPRAALLGRPVLDAGLDDLAARLDNAVILGRHNEAVYVALDISDLAETAAAGLAPEAELVDLRDVGAVLPAVESGLLAYARGIVHWHRQHRFCGHCGARAEAREGGHMRICSAKECARLHFPRTDPAVIMAITRNDRVLLGRQKNWAAGLYSTLAGFVEPGESLEDAVRREVFEEAGVAVGRVAYHSSQPWPFPASLMIGFVGEALDDAIELATDELEDARWFSREELATAGNWLLERDLSEAGDGSLRLPNTDSISRRLIDDWRAGRTP